jgi:hypothetical protein
MDLSIDEGLPYDDGSSVRTVHRSLLVPWRWSVLCALPCCIERPAILGSRRMRAKTLLLHTESAIWTLEVQGTLMSARGRLDLHIGPNHSLMVNAGHCLRCAM